MNQERIQEVFSDETFVKELLSRETPEEVQKMLADKKIDLSIDDILKIRTILEKKLDQSAELSDDELEDVSGGVVVIGAIVYSVLPLIAVTLICDAILDATNTRW
jgi:predicted ribosomally synthesized peptide with nif11-like leader